MGQPRVTILARFTAKEGVEGKAERAIAACVPPPAPTRGASTTTCIGPRMAMERSSFARTG